MMIPVCTATAKSEMYPTITASGRSPHRACGTATTTINRELNDAKRKQSVEDLVRKLIDRVPKK